ncbi:uncharacterized protein K441DRAFT_662357 [Cenococcum geophilum 1.58]|uniref:uncharacterized protein n=1 Tax=Cenococcum geophilum 1.58 TaxID=794803 RepID=UPI00358FCAF3|nr:hypothetical protein K441DRAFT_662357 [Cenococcum geophilum 1.58]
MSITEAFVFLYIVHVDKLDTREDTTQHPTTPQTQQPQHRPSPGRARLPKTLPTLQPQNRHHPPSPSLPKPRPPQLPRQPRQRLIIPQRPPRKRQHGFQPPPKPLSHPSQLRELRRLPRTRFRPDGQVRRRVQQLHV